MGLKSKWHDKTNFWGFSTVEMERIAEHQQANVFLLQSVKESTSWLLSGVMASCWWQVYYRHFLAARISFIL